MKPQWKELALQIIYGQDFDTLGRLLDKLDEYSSMTCDYCGRRLEEHSDKRVAARNCDE